MKNKRILILMCVVSAFCRDHKSYDSVRDLGILYLLSGNLPGHGVNYELINSLGGIRTGRNQIVKPALYSELGVPENIAGISPENFGDAGVNDGFADKFITPEAVSMQFCRLLAYKSESAGGPKNGYENYHNFDIVLTELSVKENTDCSGFTQLALSSKRGKAKWNNTSDSLFSKLTPEHDRIGVAINGVNYFFSPIDVKDESYRYVNILLASRRGFDLRMQGEVQPNLFGKTCTKKVLIDPGYMFSLPPENPLTAASDYNDFKSCVAGLSRVNASNGVQFYTDYSIDLPYMNQPTNSPQIHYTGIISQLNVLLDYDLTIGVDLPVRKSAMETAYDPYILIIPFDNSKTVVGVNIKVSAENALFWDSNGDNIFAPESQSESDRPAAINRNSNLTNPSLKNLKFHLPIMIGTAVY